MKYTFITLALVSYLRSLVVRAVHWHRTCVGSIPAGGPYSWWIFLNRSRLEFRHVYNSRSILRHINPSENFPHRVKCHKIMMIYPQPYAFALLLLPLASKDPFFLFRFRLVVCCHRTFRPPSWSCWSIVFRIHSRTFCFWHISLLIF